MNPSPGEVWALDKSLLIFKRVPFVKWTSWPVVISCLRLLGYSEGPHVMLNPCDHYPFSFFFPKKIQLLSSSIKLTVVLSKRHQNSHSSPWKEGRRLVFRKTCEVLTQEYSDIHSMTNPRFLPEPFFFFKRDLKISTPIMRLYPQLTSGQILFSASSNWEFFMVKDKKNQEAGKTSLRN